MKFNILEAHLNFGDMKEEIAKKVNTWLEGNFDVDTKTAVADLQKK